MIKPACSQAKSGPLWNGGKNKHYFSLQGRPNYAVCKDGPVFGRTLFCLLPDVNCYDVQHVAICGRCDWSRTGLLSGDATR